MFSIYYTYSSHAKVQAGVGCVFSARGRKHDGQDRHTAMSLWGFKAQVLIGSERQVFHAAGEGVWGPFAFFF